MIWVVSSNILWRSLALFMNDKWTVHRSMGSAIKWDQAPCLRDTGREAQRFPHFDDLVCVSLKVPWKEIDLSCLLALAFLWYLLIKMILKMLTGQCAHDKEVMNWPCEDSWTWYQTSAWAVTEAHVTILKLLFICYNIWVLSLFPFSIHRSF